MNRKRIIKDVCSSCECDPCDCGWGNYVCKSLIENNNNKKEEGYEKNKQKTVKKYS